MNRLKFDDFASDFDELFVDVEELQNQADGPDGDSLDKIARVPDDVRDVADDSSDYECDA